MAVKIYDLVIVGGGILGAACAWKLKLHRPGLNILLLEKESAPAQHQTGRNSGVIHAGVYYQHGSLKAQFCRQGLEETIGFCQQYNLPYNQCGKLLVATDDTEEQRMAALFQRCQQNDLQPLLLSKSELNAREPNIDGQAAIFVKHTGITDYQQITASMLSLFQAKGGEVQYGRRVSDFSAKASGIEISTGNLTFQTRQLLNCAGLMSDKIARLYGLSIDTRIIPFRGEYFQLPTKYNQIVQHLIYPIPDPALPFLGVHLTRMIDGSVTVGPNAVLAMAREGYSKSQVNITELFGTLSFPGFWRLLRKYPGSSVQELKNSLFQSGYLQQVQKYCPQIQLQDLLPYPSGVRAQAVNKAGELCHDFEFAQDQHSLHVINAPSPAATSALPIAKHIIDKLKDRF